jgi:tetratricopeptide (TPR) repeat protein
MEIDIEDDRKYLETLKQKMVENPKDVDALIHLGRDVMEIDIEDDRKYLETLKQKIVENPKDVDALIHLGVVLWEPFHEHREAARVLQQAIQYDPKNVDARFWLAKCLYHDFCEFWKAKDVLIEALKLDPTRADCLSLMDSINRDLDGPLEESITYTKKAVENAPDWPILRQQLAELYIQVGEIEAAEREVNIGFKLASLPPKKFNNAVEYYYENIVTGRARDNPNKDFSYILNRIHTIKANYSKYKLSQSKTGKKPYNLSYYFRI